MNRRNIAIALFALLAIAEIGDLVGLISTLADPTAAAAMLGITPRAESIRAIILVALAVLIIMNALIAVAGAAGRSGLLFQFGALMTGVGLVLYGAYQALSAIFQHGQLLFVGVGLIYAALGALAFWFARSTPAIAAKPRPST